MDEADHLADQIIVINNGKIIAEGTSDQLKQRIGSERLEIVVETGSNFEKAKKVIEDDSSLRSDDKMRTLSLVTKGGVNQLKQVLSRLDEASIEVENISFRSPTLDDVFLTLTGHTCNDQEEKQKSKEAIK
jgi:ABC-2 type transport system ATP-binding protein